MLSEIGKICFVPIGIIKTPFGKTEGTPIQSRFDRNTEGTVELFPEYTEGLKDLEGFSHIILIYTFHKAGKPKLTVRPYLEDVEHGIFAVRGPSRPNPIGISVVELIRIEDNILHIRNIDILNGTPLLDIKPYIKYFDCFPDSKAGWTEKHAEKLKKGAGITADLRFG